MNRSLPLTTSMESMETSGHAFQDHLELIAEMSASFAASQDVQQTVSIALELIRSYMDAEAASLFMLSDDGLELECRACVGASDITGLRMPSDKGIVGRTVQQNVVQIVRDVRNDPDHHKKVDEDTGFVTRSILSAAMSVRNRRLGAIQVINRNGGDGLFNDGHKDMLRAMAASAALAIINAQMAAQMVNQERVRREMELAAEVQRNLLPQPMPDGYPVAGLNTPALEVSGDFFDIFEVADGRIWFALADVSGKGMNAALLMAKTSALFRALGRTAAQPGELFVRINEEICETSTHGMFVTMVGGYLDRETGIVRIANAGHEPPLLRRTDGVYETFPADAQPLGIITFPGMEFPVTEIDIGAGTLYVYTDGVTEGYDETGEMLGADGVKAILDDLAGAPLKHRLQAVTDRLTGHGAKLHDDITILGIDRSG
ncbi:MAG: SpoIIE family protein phosphatase [Rhodospirillales bacterium]